MFLHEMSVAERIESIVHIASKLAGVGASAAFLTEWPTLVIGCRTGGCPPGIATPCTMLRVVARDGRPSPAGAPNEWIMQVGGTHTGAAEEMLTHAMLLSLAHEAQVCPRCRESLARRAGAIGATKRYSCSCGMVVVESGG